MNHVFSNRIFKEFLKTRLFIHDIDIPDEPCTNSPKDTRSLRLIDGKYGSFVYDDESKLFLISVGTKIFESKTSFLWNSILLYREYNGSWANMRSISSFPVMCRTVFTKQKAAVYSSITRSVMRALSASTSSLDSVYSEMNRLSNKLRGDM